MYVIFPIRYPIYQLCLHKYYTLGKILHSLMFSSFACMWKTFFKYYFISVHHFPRAASHPLYIYKLKSNHLKSLQSNNKRKTCFLHSIAFYKAFYKDSTLMSWMCCVIDFVYTRFTACNFLKRAKLICSVF